MTIKLLGPSVDIIRIKTGFWSLDNACRNNRNELGIAIPAFIEVYGDNGVGKTAFVVALAGIIAGQQSKNIAFLDWEIQDMNTIVDILEVSGFDGDLQRILEKKDEDSIDAFYDIMEDETYAVGIMDSIAAFRSIAEDQGKQSDVIMGKRALNMAKFSRTCIRNMQHRKSPVAVLCTNHMHPKIGFMQTGMDTAGGETKKYMTTYRMWIKKFYWKAKKRTETLPAKADPPIGWILEGRLDKNRTGYAFTKFHVAMIMGEGLHKGLSALYDCLIYGHASLDRKVKMDGQEFYTMKKFIRDRDDESLFIPFQNKLKSLEFEDKSIEDE